MSATNQRSARPATPEDEDFLWRLYASTRADELAALGWPPQQQEMFLRLQYRARCGSYAAAFPDAEHSVLLAGGVPAGAMIVSRTAAEIRLVDIALLPEQRNRGYGARELANLIAQSTASGLPLRLSVRCENRAVHLYQRLGFVSLKQDAMYIEMEYRAKGAEIADRPSA